MHPVTKMKRKKKFKSEANLSLAKSTGVISGTKIEYNTTSFILTVCEVVTVSKKQDRHYSDDTISIFSIFLFNLMFATLLSPSFSISLSLFL